MSDPYTDQAKVLASLSAENGLLRVEIERLRAIRDGCERMLQERAAELERLRLALKPFAVAFRALERQSEPMPSWHSVSTNDLWRAAEALEGK